MLSRFGLLENKLLVLDSVPKLTEIATIEFKEVENEDVMGQDGELFSITDIEPKGELFRSDENLDIF